MKFEGYKEGYQKALEDVLKMDRVLSICRQCGEEDPIDAIEVRSIELKLKEKPK